MRDASDQEPRATRAVLFSLTALCDSGRPGVLRAMAARYAPCDHDDQAERLALFASRAGQIARWYQDQRFYLQREMLRESRAAALRALGIETGPDDAGELDELWLALTSRLRPRAGAFELLAALRRASIRTGIVSNCDRDDFVHMWEHTGLGAAVDVRLCSEEAGSCKPDPVIFYEALRRLRVRPCEALFVGASPEIDIRGARIVGMRSVLIAGHTVPRWETGGFAPDHTISSLSEVAALVARPAPSSGPRTRRAASQVAALTR